ncbi:MAG: acetoacetyl-CoA reductase [Pseudomonadota bacterium]
MGKVALVTGGTRGIGEAISIALKDAGFNVIANYAGNDERANAFKAANQIEIVKFDVGDARACAENIAEIEAAHGPIEVLINNAAVTRDGFFHKMSAEQWRTVMTTGLDSLYNCTRPVIEGMRNRGYGRIVNISSINGQKGQVGQVNYSAAKAGVIGFTKALALESSKKGVTVNCVAPGYVTTDMTSAMNPDVLKSVVDGIPAGRMGEPEEVARIVTYLVQDSGYINGATIAINGGQNMVG